MIQACILTQDWGVGSFAPDPELGWIFSMQRKLTLAPVVTTAVRTRTANLVATARIHVHV